MKSSKIAEYIQYKQPIVLFSGGKDSLCTLSYVKEIAEEVGVDLIALHSWSTCSLPGVTDYVREVCRKLKVALVVVKPEITFWEFAENVGFPHRRWRWCCRVLKVEPIKKYVRAIGKNKPVLLFDGRRKAERTRRKLVRDYGFDKVHKCWWISPIFYWTDEQVEAYLREKDLHVSPVYRVLKFSGECICGAFIHKKQMRIIKAHYPEFFERLVELENMRRTGYTFIFDGNKRLPLKELKKEKLIEEWTTEKP